MVRTGKRASELARLLEAGGRTLDTSRAAAPRVEDLESSIAADILWLYRNFGGSLQRPRLLPGAWDLSMDGVLIELDEELHFNRYRKATVRRPWATSLPWAASYAQICGERERECLRAATWGKRWSSPSSARLFGSGAPPGDLETDGGAPRWKQRALYDAIKDAAAIGGNLRAARLSVHDDVSGVPLGAALEGRQRVNLDKLASLLAERTS